MPISSLFSGRLLSASSLSALVGGLLIFSGCSHKMAPEGHYQATPVVADGQTDDWSLPLRFSNEAYTIQYNVTNDDRNLYVCVLSRDYATQLRILRSGMSIWFDPKGEKNRSTGILFPLKKPADPDSYRSRNGSPLTPDSKSRRDELLLQSDTYTTSGFGNTENGQFALTDTKGPVRLAMRLNNHDSILVYEVIVPLAQIPGLAAGSRTASKNFSVGIVLNASPGQGGNTGNGGRSGYGGGGMRGGMMGMGMRGGMMGGGMGGGGRGRYGGGGNSNSSGAKEEANWYPFRLATDKHG